MLRDLNRIEYPREKLIKYGLSKLSDDELLSLIIRTGRKGENVVNLSKKVLNLILKKGINSITISDLTDIKGIGITKASQIISSIELIKRLNLTQKPEILTPKEVYTLMSEYLSSKKECLIVFILNSRNILISKELVSIGTVNEAMLHPREVYELAIKSNATAIIISHNHPSGDYEPSREDCEMTKTLVKAGEILGIKLLDHVIVSTNGFYSFKDNDFTLSS